MLELFENIITGEKTSKYKTNHFHMIVDADIQIPNVNDMSDEAFGTLIHEYVHYIQHISTLFGIRTCSIFHKMSIMYRIYIDDHDKIELPLKLWESDKHIYNFLDHLKDVSGSKNCSYNVDAVDINVKDIETAKEFHTAVNIGCYDFENEKIYENGFKFGYTCVMESMAHNIQKLFVKEVNHFTIPYCAAELVLQAYYPEIVNDKKLIVSICYCALHWDNPGVGFFDVVEIAKANPNWNGVELYRHIAQDYAVNYKNESMPRFRLVQKFLKEFKIYLAQLLGTPLDYYQYVIDNCLKEAGTSSSLLLEILYNEPLDDKAKIFSILANFYGYPLIEANNLTILPNKNLNNTTPKPYLENAVLLGWELILTRFAEFGGEKNCCHLPFCLKGIYTNPTQCAVTEECTTMPWVKKEACPFTQCMKYFKMDNKMYKEKMIKKGDIF